MHDPLVVAFKIRLPVPLKTSPTFKKIPGGKSWYFSKRWYLQIGQRAWRCPTLVIVWHREPGGRDSGTVCKRNQRGWHIHHWRVQVPALQMLRRKLLTRCAWCGGKHTKKNPVDISHSWDGVRGPWWRGERGLFHHHCSSVPSAKRQCLCDVPSVLFDEKYGDCMSCGKRRYGDIEPHHLAVRRLYAAIPDGQKPSAELRAQIAAIATQRKDVAG